MPDKLYNRETLAFVKYYKKADDSQTCEIAPFAIHNMNVGIHNENGESCDVKYQVCTNLFDANLVSIINNKGVQNQSITEIGWKSRKIKDSSIIIKKILLSSEIILKMPTEIRQQLLEKNDLNTKEVLTVFDFAYENLELLGFTKEDTKSQKR